MKAIPILLVAGFLSGAAVPELKADGVTKNAKIEQIFALAKLDQTLQQTLQISENQIKSGFFQQLMGVQLTPDEQNAMTGVQQKLSTLLKTALSWDVLKPEYVKLYADMFSEDEIDGMLAFYQTPAGRAMIEKTPKLMMQANTVVQQRMLAMKPQFEELIKEANGLKGK